MFYSLTTKIPGDIHALSTPVIEKTEAISQPVSGFISDVVSIISQTLWRSSFQVSDEDRHARSLGLRQ
jgi:hypothetical protein